MRAHTHNAAVRFRVNEALLAAATHKAQREGMSLSELLRHAVRNAVRDAV
ncbi:ribbon-helix-helix protein, CopG family [Sphingobium vermicomposti]|uniref:Antitoxin component of RelBE/YafQ-DinJ toxin-antitoxin module n=1 Tax=Sphingobium vermicomposti TaxID=529005 RepID=A0A846M2U3_9SPHN|nr:antitoxin component of RelBE/YafQ-DinJ toxin-antitoxin module [Sphingobium vermicomposti]